MRLLVLSVLGLAAGCQDYRLFDRDGEVDGVDGMDTDGAIGWADDYPPIDGELCNGQDDDGDGQIDEGHPDIDGDGIADCVDRDCDIERPVPVEVDIDGDCAPEGGEVGDPWDVVIEWRWTGLAEDTAVRNVLVPPMVANLTDDNWDGVVNQDDVPDVVFVAFPDTSFDKAVLVVLDGATGDEHWHQAGFHAYGGVALADVDSDGVTDILAFDRNRAITAVDAAGDLLWRGTRRAASSYPQVTVANIDGVGAPEVLADDLVLDGATGAIRWRAQISDSLIGRMPAVGDIDLDGGQEVLLGQKLFGPTGIAEWESPVAGTYGHWAAIIDADGDPYGEIAVVGGGRLVVHEHDGTVIVDVQAGTDQPGPPCAADFDGDGQTEIAWGSSTSFNMYELDGTEVWSWPMVDASGLAGCSGYDFDSDGAFEVLFADEEAFYIFDGATGQMRYGSLGHASGTIFEYPVVADVDNDGSAEVLLASSNYRVPGWAGVAAFGQAQDDWPKSGTTWHVHDFAVTNIDPNGAVPARPSPPWQVHNVYRARPAEDGETVDLQVSITDVCFTGCVDSSRVLIAVQVFNTGSSTSRPHVPVALYADYDGLLELVEVQIVPGRVPAGTGVEGLVFDLTLGALGPSGFVVRVDDDGSGGQVQPDECNEDNNEDRWTDRPC